MAWRRAGVQLRARGACTNSPSVRACVRGAGPPAALLARGGAGRRARGRGPGGPDYSTTRQRGRCCEKYLKSSGVAPGQLVSSSSSRSCSCTRPDSPVAVSSGQPAEGRGLVGVTRAGPGPGETPPLAGWDLGRRESTPGVGLHEGPGTAGGVGLGGDEWPLPRRAAQGLTCQRQETQTPHGQEVLQPEVLHLGGRAGRVSYFRSRLEGAPLLASGRRGKGVGSQVPTESLRALGTPCAPLGCEGIPDFLTGSEWASLQVSGISGCGLSPRPPPPSLLPSLWRHGGLIPGSTIAGRGCGGTTWWTNS